MTRLLRQLNHIAIYACLACLLAACAGFDTGQGAPSPTEPGRTTRDGAASTGRSLDPAQAERLQRIMVPLLRVMNHPRSASQVRVAVVEDSDINAGSAGSGQFIVTTGLLRRANDDQLLAVLAHEVAHDDLGHVARLQALGAGLSVATVLLDQILPGSGQFTPIAGTLVARAYGRNEEYEADRHGVELLRRIGREKEVMIGTLSWLMQTSGPSGGGFFSTHPGTGDRIERLRKMA